MSSAAHNLNETEPNFESRSEVKTFWRKTGGAILLALIFAILVFIVSSAADYFMLHEHQNARLTIELSDGVSAALIGILSYRVIRQNQERRQRLRQRIEVIADMNHHVRNALQVISLTSHGKTNDEIVAIRESVNRIQWALRELLPKI